MKTMFRKLLSIFLICTMISQLAIESFAFSNIGIFKNNCDIPIIKSEPTDNSVNVRPDAKIKIYLNSSARNFLLYKFSFERGNFLVAINDKEVKATYDKNSKIITVENAAIDRYTNYSVKLFVGTQIIDLINSFRKKFKTLSLISYEKLPHFSFSFKTGSALNEAVNLKADFVKIPATVTETGTVNISVTDSYGLAATNAVVKMTSNSGMLTANDLILNKTNNGKGIITFQERKIGKSVLEIKAIDNKYGCSLPSQKISKEINLKAGVTKEIVFDKESYSFDKAYGLVSFSVKDPTVTTLANIKCKITTTGKVETQNEVSTDATGKAYLVVFDKYKEAITLKAETLSGTSKTVNITFANSFVPEAAPPVNISQSHGNIDLSWNSVVGATYYKIERKLDNEAFKVIKNFTVENIYHDADLVSGKTYFYRVIPASQYDLGPKSQELRVDYTCPMDNLGELKIVDKAVYVGEGTQVIFRIQPPERLANNLGIQVVLLDGTTEIAKTVLYDDGNLNANGDDLRLDGVYSGILTINESATKNLKFKAFTQVSMDGAVKRIESTNQLDINVIKRITEAEATAFIQLINDTSGILAQNMINRTTAAAVEQTVNQLRSNPGIEAAGISTGTNTIWFRTKDGITGVIPVVTPDTQGMDSISFNADKDGKNTTYAVFNAISQTLAQKGYYTTVSTDSNATVESFKNLSAKKVIIMNNHGGLQNNRFFILTGEEAIPAKLTQYEKDIGDDILSIVETPKGKYFAVTMDFIKKYNSNLDDSVIFLAACQGLNNDDPWKVFNSMGAKTLLGFSGEVYKTYVAEVARVSFNGMLNDGLTVGQAFNRTISELGNNDNQFTGRNEKAPAYFKKYGEDEISLLTVSTFANGSFENGFSGWKTSGDSRIIPELGEIKPTNGNNMAIISTGIGSINDSNSILEQKFMVPDNAQKLTFDYNVVSEEPLEYVGSQFDDKFECEVELLLDKRVIASESINASVWKPVTGVDFPGGDQTAFMTGWKNIDFDLTAYRGKNLTLRFHVWDVGDSAFDTAALIDNIRLDGNLDGQAFNSGYDPHKIYLRWPVESTEITMPFGQVDDVIDFKHSGLDIQSPMGSEVYSVVNGDVIFAGFKEGYGNVVYINSVFENKNIQTKYAHLSELKVAVGAKVYQGNVIGKVGNSGNTYGGSVLHFEVLESTDGNSCTVTGSNAKAVDPKLYLLPMRPVSTNYLSNPMAFGIVPGDDLGTMGMYLNPAMNNQYLQPGEVYLRKIFVTYSTPNDSLEWKSTSNAAIIVLNGKEKGFGEKGLYSNARNVNGRLIIKKKDFLDFFFPGHDEFPTYPGYDLSTALSGNFDENVQKVQLRLIELGYQGQGDNTVYPTGYFDINTQYSIGLFKGKNGLNDNQQYQGKVGIYTWYTIFSPNAIGLNEVGIQNPYSDYILGADEPVWGDPLDPDNEYGQTIDTANKGKEIYDLSKVIQLAGKTLGLDVAADNLGHYLANTGTPIPVVFSRMNNEILPSQDGVPVNKDFDLTSVMRAAEKLSLDDKTIEIVSTKEFVKKVNDKDTNWLMGIGEYRTWIKAKVIKHGDEFQIELTYNMRDTYDFHKEKDGVLQVLSLNFSNIDSSIPIMPNDDLDYLNKIGMAREFKITGSEQLKFSWKKGQSFRDVKI